MAVHTYVGEARYRPSDEEREAIVAALGAAEAEPESLQDWRDVRAELRNRG